MSRATWLSNEVYLSWSKKELSDHLFPNQPGVDGSPHIIGVNCPGCPVHAYHVAILLFFFED